MSFWDYVPGGETISGAIDTVGDYAGGAISSAAEFGGDVVNTISEAGSGAINTIAEAGGGVIDSATGLGGAVNGAMGADGEPVYGLLDLPGKLMQDGLDSLLQGSLSFIPPALSTAGAIANGAKNVGTGLFGTAGTAADGSLFAADRGVSALSKIPGVAGLAKAAPWISILTGGAKVLSNGSAMVTDLFEDEGPGKAETSDLTAFDNATGFGSGALSLAAGIAGLAGSAAAPVLAAGSAGYGLGSLIAPYVFGEDEANEAHFEDAHDPDENGNIEEYKPTSGNKTFDRVLEWGMGLFD